jgi:hypothetical protein
VAGRRAGAALVGTLARTRQEKNKNSASLLNSVPLEGENGPRRTSKVGGREGYGVWGGGGFAEAVSFAFFMATSGNVRLHLLAAAEVCACVRARACVCVYMHTNTHTHTHTHRHTHTHTLTRSHSHSLTHTSGKGGVRIGKTRRYLQLGSLLRKKEKRKKKKEKKTG